MAQPFPLENKPRGKCRKWRLRKSTGRDPATGKYRRQNCTFEGTWTEACRAQAEFERDVDDAPAQDSRLTVSEYLADFIDARELSGDFAPRTISKYRDHAKVINHNLGHARLATLSPLQIERAYTAMRRGGSPSGRELSGTYVNCIHRTLTTALSHAVDVGLIAANPCQKVHPPTIDTPEKRALSSVGIVALLGQLGDSRDEVAILLCVMMGMRRGEVLGLSWGDVDTVQRLITVRHSMDDFGNLKAPKTRTSVRPLPMPERVAQALSALKDAQAAQFAATRKRTGASEPAQDESTPVFADKLGRRMLPHSLTRWWARNRDDFGMSGWTIHELRHSYLSELARQGVPPKVVQELAGHANVATTLSIYTHADLSQKRDAVDGFESTLTERFGPNLAQGGSERKTGQGV